MHTPLCFKDEGKKTENMQGRRKEINGRRKGKGGEKRGEKKR